MNGFRNPVEPDSMLKRAAMNVESFRVDTSPVSLLMQEMSVWYVRRFVRKLQQGNGSFVNKL